MSVYRLNEYKERAACADQMSRECDWPRCLHDYDELFRCRNMTVDEALLELKLRKERRSGWAGFKRLVRFHWRTWTGA